MSSMKDARDATFIGRRTDGTRIRRPLSPHLQVYDMLQITSGLSVMSRATAIAWTVGSAFLVWWLMAAASGPQALGTAQGFFSSFIGMLVLAGMTAVAWFHTFAGLRHLVWDAGHGYDMPSTWKSGRAVMVATAVATVLTWLIALISW